MKFRRSFAYVLTGLILFVFASGSFLDKCGLAGHDHKPCVIKIISPVNGTAFDAATKDVLIQGVIENGDSAPVSLKANNLPLQFDKTTGKFYYRMKFTPNPDNKPELFYQTSTFAVLDQKQVSNKTRVAYILHDSAEAGGNDKDGNRVVDDAVKIMFTRSFLQETCNNVCNFVNSWKKDLVYGWDNPNFGSKDPNSPFSPTGLIGNKVKALPLEIDLGSIPKDKIDRSLTIDYDRKNPDTQTGYINIGKLGIQTFIGTDGSLSANITIDPEPWVKTEKGVERALYLQGWLRYEDVTRIGGLSGNIDSGLKLTANKIELKNLKFKAVTENNKVNLVIDPSTLNINNISIKGLEIKAHQFGTLPGWLFDYIQSDVFLDAMKNILSMVSWTGNVFGQNWNLIPNIPNKFELIDVNNIIFDVANAGKPGGMSFSAWPMLPGNQLYRTNEKGQVEIIMGASAKLSAGSVPLVPGLNRFFYSNDNLPEINYISDENLIFAISDSIVNNGAMVAVQNGLMVNLELTDAIADFVGRDTWPDGLRLFLTIDTPPVIVFPEKNPDTVSHIGKAIVRNAKVRATYDKIKIYPVVLDISSDINMDLDLVISPDGQHLKGTVDLNDSSMEMIYMYDNLVSVGRVMPDLKGAIGIEVLKLIKGAVEFLVDFQIPNVPISDGKTGGTIKLNSLESKNNYLIARLKMTSSAQGQ